MTPILKFTGPAEVSKDGTITAILSTESVDRDGDIVRLSGWRLDNLDGLPLMSCHDYGSLTKQIGEWQNVRVDPQRKALIGEPVYYTDCGNPEADYAYQIALKGRARFSVGFLPHEGQQRKGAAGHEYVDQELLEASQVPIPSNRDAVQLAQKAFQQRWRAQHRQNGGDVRQKWQSNLMDPDSDSWGSPPDVHCIVAGCDDAAQTQVPICSEHLKYLMNSAPEPPGSPPDDDDLVRRGVLRNLQRVVKAGKVISAANMGKLHAAMQNLQDVHDAACTDDDCPLDDGSSSDGPPTGKSARRVKSGYQPEPYHKDADESVECPVCHHYDDTDAVYCDQCGAKLAGRSDVLVNGQPATKAMNEGSGSAGGVTVAADGSHDAFTGTHTHAHSAAGDQGSDATHSHEHTHDNDASHTSADHVGAHKGLSAADIRALVKAEMSAAAAKSRLEMKWADLSIRDFDRLSDSDKLALHYELAEAGLVSV